MKHKRTSFTSRVNNGRWNWIWKVPRYSDPDSQRNAQLMRTLLRVLMGASVLVYLAMMVSPNPWAVFSVASGLLLIDLSSLFLLQTGRLRSAMLFLIAGLTLVLGLAAVFGAGVSSVPFVGLVIVVMIAGMLLGGMGGLVMAIVACVIGLGLVVAEMNTFLPTPVIPVTQTGFWISLCAIFLATAGVIYLATTGLQTAILQARQNEQAQLQAVAELEEIKASLEDQISAHTRELEQRSGYLQAIMDVSQSTAALLDQGQVMHTAVRLIKEEFRLYYVGLFLVDLSGDWAVLQAGEGPGQAVQAMLERGHRIRVGSGMIGWSIANAQPRLAGEAGQDIVRLATSELPDTRSEAAIPLRSRGRVIGALSVQSQRPQAFGELEIAAFQALADQVAITLDNARLYRESTQALEEARRAYGQAGRRAWQDFLQGREHLDLTYRYGVAVETDEEEEQQIGDDRSPVIDRSPSAELLQVRRQVLAGGQPVQVSTGHKASLFLPIPVREITIGVISFTKETTGQEAPDEEHVSPAAGRWSEDEIELLQTIVEQMGIALDSARLYQDTQRLAFREQVIGEVTAHIRQTLDIQTVLQTAAEEVQRVLGLPEVIISLTADEMAEGEQPVSGDQATAEELEPAGQPEGSR